MNEQILHLDPHDDFHSARDKIGWAQTDRILLVWPPRAPAPLITRQLDLYLLQRHAARLGAKLALVTDDPSACDFAAALGLAVFDSVDDSHLHPWRSRRPLPPTRIREPRVSPRHPDDDAPLLKLTPPPWMQSERLHKLIGGLSFAAAIGAITIMLAVVLPGAQVTLVSQGQTIIAKTPITADPAQTEIDPVNGLIPAETVTVTVSGAAEAATSGTVDEATQRAGGAVTFTNLTAQAARIPAGTALRTTGGAPIRFVTQKDVSLDAKRGATADAPVLAIDPGPTGNVGAGLINSVEGPLAVQAAVINLEATRGGEVKQVASVTDEDRARLKDTLLAQLRGQGYAELLAQLKEGEFAPADAVTVSEALDETYSHFAGEKTDTLTLEMRADVSAAVVNEADAFAVGRAEIESRLGDELVMSPGTLTFARSADVSVDEAGRVSFDITASADAVAAIDPEAVRAAARWQPADQAADLLYRQFPIAAKPQITIWPGWFQRLPWLAWRIEVSIEPEEK